jgi:pimeloyl-ACP methyl ester carboxylesterase
MALVVAGGVCRVAAAQIDSPVTHYSTRDLPFSSGDLRLSARLYAPRAATRYPAVVMVAGSGNQSVIGGAYTEALASAFTRAGIGVLAYDKRGTGQSTGDFTGSDFEALGRDAAAAIRFVKGRSAVEQVGVWGISQAGWIIPYAIRENPGVAFAILVSPAGVNPNEQVTFFLHRQMRKAGLTEEEAEQADSMHRATVLYYANGHGYPAAQSVVDRYRSEPWFHRVVTHPYWDEMTDEGRLLTPTQLADAVAKRPGDYELVRSKSTFVDYGKVYEWLTLPTLVVYGSADELVPISRSRDVIERALQRRGPMSYEFKIFEAADHQIQTTDGKVRPDYLEFLVGWGRSRFAP